MDKKYELLKDDINYCGLTVHRIKALRDFNSVKKGDIGGYIEKEENLSQDGDCWVYDNAIVYENATVTGNAIVCDYAKVNGTSIVTEHAIVSDYAEVTGTSIIHQYAEISGNANIHNSEITGNVKVGRFANVENCNICGRARLFGDAYILDNNSYICIGPLGDCGWDYVTFYKAKPKFYRPFGNYITDNFTGILVSENITRTLEEFIKDVNGIRDEKYKKQYLDVIEYAKKYLGEENNNMKALKVEMTVMVKDDKYTDSIKQWEHHIDYAINMDEYPEIDHIEDVKVTEIASNIVAAKYVLLEDRYMVVGDHKLYRIKAIRDFGNVKEGDLGGFIEKESNLSHEGNCWVYNGGCVYDNAQLHDNAAVYDIAQVFGNVQLRGNTLVRAGAQLCGEYIVENKVIDKPFIIRTYQELLDWIG